MRSPLSQRGHPGPFGQRRASTNAKGTSSSWKCLAERTDFEIACFYEQTLPKGGGYVTHNMAIQISSLLNNSLVVQKTQVISKIYDSEIRLFQSIFFIIIQIFSRLFRHCIRLCSVRGAMIRTETVDKTHKKTFPLTSLLPMPKE